MKPENILVDSNDNVRLCDFGWCADISTGNRIILCGTYEYYDRWFINEKDDIHKKMNSNGKVALLNNNINVNHKKDSFSLIIENYKVSIKK